MDRIEGHVTVISADDAAHGGWVLACCSPGCDFRREGTEAQLVGASMDHYDDTLPTRA